MAVVRGALPPALLLLLAALTTTAGAVRSFGRGADQGMCVGSVVEILRHTVESPSRMGVMDHFCERPPPQPDVPANILSGRR